MKEIKNIVIGIIICLVPYTILAYWELSISDPDNIDYVNKYSKLKLFGIPLIIFVFLLLALYLIPHFVKIIKAKHNNYKHKQNRPINLIKQYHKRKYIKELNNLTNIEKDILFLYFIEPNELCHNFDENFPQLKILYNLYSKNVLYKPHDNNDVLIIDNQGIRHYKFCINKIVKKYLDKHKKLLNH